MSRTGIARVLLALAIASVATPAGTGMAAEGEAMATAPDFALKSTAGPNLRLSEHRGKVVVVAFWAGWCGECRAELEELKSLHARYAGIGLEILAVNLDSEMRQARDGAESLGLSFPVLHDAGGRVAGLYAVDDVPVTVLVDREGTIREVAEGYGRAESEYLADRLRALLRE